MIKRSLSVIAAFLIVVALVGTADLSRAAVSTDELTGNYYMIWIGPDGETSVGFDGGILEFDGAGGWVFPENSSGTYSINENGLLTVTDTSTDPDHDVTTKGAVSADGSLIILPEMMESDSGVVLLIKQPNSATAEDLKGERYNYTEFSFDNGQLETIAGYADFDSTETTLTPYEEYNSIEGSLSSSPGTLDYEVSTDGTITFPGNPSLEGILSPDGNFILIVSTESETQISVIFLVKASSPGKDAIFGRYNLAAFYADVDSEDYITGNNPPEYGYLNFDGSGSWENHPFDEEEESGTYDFDQNGRLLIDGQMSYGTVTPDGGLVIVPDMDPDEGSDLGVAFLVKAPAPAVTITQTSTGVTLEGTPTSETKNESDLQAEYQDVPDNFKVFSETVSFNASLTPDDIARFGFDARNLSGSVENMKLLKLKEKASGESSLEFKYAAENQAGNLPSNWEDGTWWIVDPDTSNYLQSSAELDAEKTYPVYFVIQDNGDYDQDGDPGAIKDPTVLGAGVTASSSSSSDDGDDSSSGCFINTLAR